MDPKVSSTCSVRHLIVDSAGFLKDASLKDIGENIYTIEQVVNEIRDRATRSRLQVLPYDLHFKTPSTESIKFVTDFSKKTGDYASLSAVDLQVIALTFQLHKEHGDASQIKNEPNKNVLVETRPKNVAVPKGFYFEKNYNKKGKDDESSNDNDNANLVRNESENLRKELDDKCVINDTDGTKIRGDDDEDGDDDDAYSDEDEWFSSEDVLDEDDENVGDDDDKENDENDEDDEENENDEEDEEEEEGEKEATNDNDDGGDDDGGGWITPKNIALIRKTMSEQPSMPTEPLQVACLTTDFAMQNVLIQMGLNIVSLNGLLIRHARSYVLKCSACFKVTKDVSKVFCHHCGNQTLQKVAMTVKEDGSVVFHVSKTRQPNLRGLRYALPTPKGGKHAHNPILCPDQLSTHDRPKGSKKQLDPLHPDYIARDRPFSLHALNAKRAASGAKNWDVQPTVGRRKNPNENRKCKGKK